LDRARSLPAHSPCPHLTRSTTTSKQPRPRHLWHTHTPPPTPLHARARLAAAICDDLPNQHRRLFIFPPPNLILVNDTKPTPP
jgi:hypothetical protein